MPTVKKIVYANAEECKNCGSTEGAVRNGFRYVMDKDTGERKKIQRLMCKHCQKAFYPASKVDESDRINERRQVNRLILHLYISGKTRGEITKALQGHPVGQKEINKYINDFFDGLSPSVKKFLNDQRPGHKIKSYHQCINKIDNEPDYSLYLQEGEKHLAYALFFSNMPSVVNILLDNLLDPQPKFRNYLRSQIIKELMKAETSNIYEIVDVVVNRLKNSLTDVYGSELNKMENRIREAYGYTDYRSYEDRKKIRFDEREFREQEQYFHSDMKTYYFKKK